MSIPKQTKAELKSSSIQDIKLVSQDNTVTGTHKTVIAHAKIGNVKYLWHLPTHGSMFGEKLTGQPLSQQLTFGDWILQQYQPTRYKSLCEAAQISSDTTHATVHSAEFKYFYHTPVDTRFIAPTNYVTVEDGWKLHSGLHCFNSRYDGTFEWQGVAEIDPPQGYTGSVAGHIFNEKERHTILSVLNQKEEAIFDDNMWDKSVKLYEKMQKMTVAAQKNWDEFDQNFHVR